MTHRPIQTVQRAFAALEAVAQAPEGLTLKDLAATLQCSSSSAYHLMQTICECGYLERRSSPQRYLLGHRSYELGRRWRDEGYQARIADIAERCRDALPGASFSYCQLRGNEVIITSHADRHGGPVVHDDERELMPYTSMASMIHLAWWDAQQHDRYRKAHPFEEFGIARWGSEAALDAQLAGIRRQGFFIYMNDDSRHCRSAIPVFSPEGRLLASLTVDWDPPLGMDDWQERCQSVLQEAADQLRAHLARGDEA